MAYPRRLPLNNIEVSSTKDLNLNPELIDLIKDELNVKNVSFKSANDNIKVKLNYKIAGRKYKDQIKWLEQFIQIHKESLIGQYKRQKEIDQYIIDHCYLDKEDLIFTVDKEQSTEEYECQSLGDLSIKLDLSVNDDQVYEYICNEICAKIQAYRRDNNFDVVKPVWITIHSPVYLWDYMFQYNWKDKLNPTGVRFIDISVFTNPNHCNVLSFDVNDLTDTSVNVIVEVTKAPFELIDYWKCYCKWIDQKMNIEDILYDLQECFGLSWAEYLRQSLQYQ